MSSRSKSVIGWSIAVIAVVGILGMIIRLYTTADERQAASDLAKYNAMLLPAKAHQATLVENREISECVNEAVGADLRKYRVLSILPNEDSEPNCWDEGIYNTYRSCSYPLGSEIRTESAWKGQSNLQVFRGGYDDLKLTWTNEISYTLTMDDGPKVSINPQLMKAATPNQVCKMLTKKLQDLIEQRLE